MSNNYHSEKFVDVLSAKAKRIVPVLSFLIVMVFVAACGSQGTYREQAAQAEGLTFEGMTLTGDIEIDGSSTVYPISAAVAEEYMDAYPGVNVTVAISGTGGGFKKSTRGEIDISNASRPIKDSELQIAEENGIEFIELTVAIDGISVVVNPDNDFVDYLTVDELKAIWQSGRSVKLWSDVRSDWPAEPIKLYGPGADSGTNDYFVEAIIGDEGIRADFQASEDDNVLVTGVAHDKYALGFFGYAYYVENSDKLRAVPIDNGSGPVVPTDETINNGTYEPLSRPVFIYVNRDRYETDPVVHEFVNFYLDNAQLIAPQVGYIALPDDQFEQQKKKLAVINE